MIKTLLLVLGIAFISLAFNPGVNYTSMGVGLLAVTGGLLIGVWSGSNA